MLAGHSAISGDRSGQDRSSLPLLLLLLLLQLLLPVPVGSLLVMSVHAASSCLDCSDACLKTATTASRPLLVWLLLGSCCCFGACSSLTYR
jgi:hypothetical protein